MSEYLKSLFCCCCKKQPRYTYICDEGNLEEEEKRNLRSPLLDKKITTSVFRNRSRCSSLSKLIIEAKDLIIDKEENPAIYYEKLSELGEGSFGKVYKVKHLKTGVVRALKVLNKSDKEQSDVLLEGEVLKSLSHPNIIKIFEVYSYGTSVYLIEEFVKGGDLFSKISKMDHLSEPISLAVMKQIFSAVHYLHSNNLVHGDLKLENIMVESLNIKKRATLVLANSEITDEFDVKLIDFGCSSLFFKDKPLTELIGTVFYLAPEVIYGSYNHKCDIWSCGVILYILLTGRFPFDGSSSEIIFEKIKKCSYRLDLPEFKYVSDDTIDLIKQCLDPDPYNRLSAEEALGHKCFDKYNLNKKDSNLFWKAEPTHSQKVDNDCRNALENIKKLNKKLVFQKAVIKYISYNLVSPDEINDIRNIYKLFDKNNDGFLTIDELLDGFYKMGIIINEEEVMNIASSLDPNGTGVIEYEDFISLFVDKSKVLEENNLKAAFELFDLDDNKAISIEEIKKIFKINNKFDEKLTEDIINQLDLKSQHEITYEEFKELMKKAYS